MATGARVTVSAYNEHFKIIATEIVATALMTNLIGGMPRLAFKLSDGRWVEIDKYTFNVPVLTPVENPDKLAELENAIKRP